MWKTAGAPPRWIMIGAVLAVLALCLPIAGMLIDMPWADVPRILSSDVALAALGVSLRTVAVSTIICVVLGVPLALLMSRTTSRWGEVLRVAVTIPMVLPPVVAGLALLSTFGKRKLLGEQLSLLGIDIAFTATAVVMAQVFVAMPFLVTSLEASLRSNRSSHAQIAATLGASPSYVLFHVTFPMMMPALVSGTALAAARCLGEFGATLTFAGSLEGTTRTIPLAIYLQREVDPDTALALALVLLVLAVLVVSVTARGRKVAR
ncbi:ABC transporter permease [Flaviflexus equikiangi]|uniref:Molybdenum transport system permease n=1 Tax=Flaviflexus equikiangi TaxID=2758573 RepID=A0ABS2TH33_9ACTO|nr:ABC transporter permease [Flaviflexus equikiangi]MBM9433973.1 molybdate ABC transporter permease subunit [Flaviflexus equikiangi]